MDTARVEESTLGSEGVLRRIRWVGVAAGAAATFSLVWVLGVYLGLLFPPDFPEGAVPTGLAWYRFVILGALRTLFSLFVIFFLGSVVTGVVVSAYPGLNGIVSSAATQMGTFLWYAGGLIPWIFVTPSNPGEVYTRDENIGNLLVVAVAFCAVFPIVVLAGYLGGRLGGRFRLAFGGDDR